MASLWDDFKGAFKTRNNELVQIIIINVLVLLVFAFIFVTLTLSSNGPLYEAFASKFKITASIPKFIHQPWSLITYFFLHENPFHLLFNMLFLYWFGQLIDEFIGGSRVTNLYVLGGLAGGILYLVMFNILPYFNDRLLNSYMLGASGSVFAVVFGAATLLPDYHFRILFLGDVKIKYIAWFYFVVSFIDLGGINAGGNIAHIGGAILGYSYIKLLQSGADIGAWLQYVFGGIKSIFKPAPPKKMPRRNSFSEATVKKNTAKNSNTSNNISLIGQEEIDAILDKISKSGYESLSKDEKIKLYAASQQSE